LLKILTLNLHKGFSHFNRRFVLHELRDAIRMVSADIVFLQDVIGEHSDHSAKHGSWPEQSQYEFLADTLWHNYAYGRNAVYTSGHHGNALLSKYPIVEYQNRDMSIPGAEKRGFLHAVIQADDRQDRLHAVCAHLGLTETHRGIQLARLCDFINDELPADARIVLAGDFNDWMGRANRILRNCADLDEVFAAANGKSARSYPARFPVLRLDRIYTRNLKATGTAVLSRRPWSRLSDHAALVASLY
jgi:endonuclease/exonuclease/phosphatase family metal-dependent hydrolase